LKKINAIQESQYVDKIIRRRLNEELFDMDDIIKSRILPGNSHWFYYDKLYTILRQGPKCKVLDVACGIGFLSVLLARYGHKVVAVDISSNSIEYAKRLAAAYNCSENIDFRVMDICKLDLDSDQFDIVTGEDALHHIIKYPGAVENIYRVLKPGGKVYFSEPFAFNPLINLMRFINVHIKNHRGEQFLGRKELNLVNSCFNDIKITDKSVIYVFSRFFQKSSARNRKINIFLKEMDDLFQSKFPFLRRFYALGFLEMTKKNGLEHS
jgi:2-polyprenyl-3-methyl-5-hydroxy-6-metoxy-1,4-benzoquinol methylase